MQSIKRIHVVAAVIYGDSEQILIARRPQHLHQGGLWEFPGGKVEAGESAYQGLVRELNEELAINVTTATPFMQVSHDYSDKQVLLDIWQVTAFTGQPRGVEGQDCRWVPLTELLGESSAYQFPDANKSILQKLAASRPHNPA
ncbi:MAG: 8-oxo-dGTP diphosphatase MutT [Porticoccaceae bacterium]|jgi:8-oxo-dGTP diphosphatase|nr:8-oxo-dGTP diphosphatase MutT [Porticoccaceae bacterium]